VFGLTAAGAGQGLFLLHCGRIVGNVSSMKNATHATVQVLTSARMAAGMTSRARRPMTFNPAG
jgi:hypothetical protein